MVRTCDQKRRCALSRRRGGGQRGESGPLPWESAPTAGFVRRPALAHAAASGSPARSIRPESRLDRGVFGWPRNTPWSSHLHTTKVGSLLLATPHAAADRAGRAFLAGDARLSRVFRRRNP